MRPFLAGSHPLATRPSPISRRSRRTRAGRGVHLSTARGGARQMPPTADAFVTDRSHGPPEPAGKSAHCRPADRDRGRAAGLGPSFTPTTTARTFAVVIADCSVPRRPRLPSQLSAVPVSGMPRPRLAIARSRNPAPNLAIVAPNARGILRRPLTIQMCSPGQTTSSPTFITRVTTSRDRN